MKAALWAQAKINLTLDINAREGEWHPLDSMVLPLALGDRLEARRGQAPASLRLSRPCPQVPEGEGNLALAAVRLLESERGAIGLDLGLAKEIPVGAGLGGGSSDAYAALQLADLVEGLGLDGEELAEVGAGAGADVAVFSAAGAARMRGRGQRVERLAPAPALLWAAVGTAGEPVGTAEAYGWLDDAGWEPGSRTEAAAAAWEAGDLEGALGHAGNDFWPVVAARRPALHAARDALKGTGPMAHGLTGTGNALFALYASASGAEEGRAALAECGAAFSWAGRVAA